MPTLLPELPIYLISIFIIGKLVMFITDTILAKEYTNGKATFRLLVLIGLVAVQPITLLVACDNTEAFNNGFKALMSSYPLLVAIVGLFMVITITVTMNRPFHSLNTSDAIKMKLEGNEDLTTPKHLKVLKVAEKEVDKRFRLSYMGMMLFSYIVYLSPIIYLIATQ
ncbi:membrane hypothetical protein [Vibrio chagasii]|nr:membrane hypothetical protein [Vibrio chagasii]